MNDTNGDAPAEPVRGRFLLAPADGSGAVLYWSTGLCETCLGCGCGTQREPLDLTPKGAMGTFMKLRKMQQEGIPT